MQFTDDKMINNVKSLVFLAKIFGYVRKNNYLWNRKQEKDI